MRPSEGNSGKKSGLLLSALAALSLSGDATPGLKNKPDLEDGLTDTRSSVTKIVDVRESDPQSILSSLKAANPELASANQDAALLEVIGSLGDDLLDFLNTFGAEALLILALLYSSKKRGAISLDNHPEIKEKLETQLVDAKNLASEIDAASNKPMSARESEILCARVAAVTTGVMLTLAPLTAEASIGDVGNGIKGSYEGLTHGLGGLLQTIGQVAEALSYASYVIDLAVLACVIGLGLKHSESIGKAWKAIKNNKVRASSARDKVLNVGRTKSDLVIKGYVVKKGKVIEPGIAQRLESRPGAAPGDIAAQTAGRTLRAALTGTTPTNPKSIIQKLLSGEIDVGHFKEETHEIGEVADEILRILAVDYTLPGAAPFPQVEFNGHVARFNALVAALNSKLHAIPKSEREFHFKDVAALIILISSLTLGYGWFKAHYFGIGSGPGVTSPYEGGSPIAPPPDIDLNSVTPAQDPNAPSVPNSAPSTTAPAAEDGPKAVDHPSNEPAPSPSVKPIEDDDMPEDMKRALEKQARRGF